MDTEGCSQNKVKIFYWLRIKTLECYNTMYLTIKISDTYTYKNIASNSFIHLYIPYFTSTKRKFCYVDIFT